MEDNQIFDLIFGDESHPELIKRSLPIIRYLYENN